MARKGYYEELKIKEYLGEITPKMFAFVKMILDGDDEKKKMEITTKLLPKIVDKVLPTQLTGEIDEDGKPLPILFNAVQLQHRDEKDNETKQED